MSSLKRPPWVEQLDTLVWNSSFMYPYPSMSPALHLPTLRYPHRQLRPVASAKQPPKRLWWTYRLLAPVGTFSILRTVSRPSMTRPKTVCLPSRKFAGAVVMKNWHPFVFGPEFACAYQHLLSASLASVRTMESNPGELCLTSKFSSSNWLP